MLGLMLPGVNVPLDPVDVSNGLLARVPFHAVTVMDMDAAPGHVNVWDALVDGADK